MRDFAFVVVLALCSALLAQTPSTTAPAARVIEDVGYTNTAALQKAWTAMPGAGPVTTAEVEGRKTLLLPVHFKGSRLERLYWDKAVKLDFTSARGITFEMNCPQVGAVSAFSIYFQSGDGWYSGSFGPSVAHGWCTVTVEKKNTRIEDKPAGWGRIETIRISPWRGGDLDTPLYIRNMRVIEQDGPIAIVSGVSVAATDQRELESVAQFTKTVADKLDELGLPYALLADTELTAEKLKGRKLVILPHNPQMPDKVAAMLVDYLKSGGKLIAFYGLPWSLQEPTGIQGGQFIGQKHPGSFASIRPVPDSPIADLPQSTAQASWNIVEAKPVAGRSRIAAQWYDQDGKPTGDAAIVASNNCVVMTHVLLDDDPADKRILLLAMAGNLVPEFWEQATAESITHIGRGELLRDLPDSNNKKQQEAARLAKTAEDLCKAHQYVAAITTADRARRVAIEAACLTYKPQAGEHRAFWCHSPFGVAGMDWDQSIKILADNGFTDIQPNMLWGGSAFYPSQVLPVAPEVAQQGDQIEKCLAACKKYGLKCHIWKVNWNLGWRTPKDFVQRMRKDGRLQVDINGQPIDWLCPSSPENQKLEIDSMLEVATKYDVDGLHFDYIRYPGPDCCYCSACRARFEKLIGQSVKNWPRDLRKPGELRDKWLEFRRSNITAVVSAVSAQARKIKPKIQISAAVFPSWAATRDSEGQDWKRWCDQGYVDFVCPMDYTEYTGLFAGMIPLQQAWAGKTPCYPGIGLSCWANRDIFRLCEQIDATRQAKTGGFTIFDYEPTEAREIVPLCGLGITRKP